MIELKQKQENLIAIEIDAQNFVKNSLKKFF